MSAEAVSCTLLGLSTGLLLAAVTFAIWGGKDTVIHFNGDEDE